MNKHLLSLEEGGFLIGANVQQDINRLEAKIDKLAEAINRLVLLEDRQIAILGHITKNDTDIDKLFSMQSDLEKKITSMESFGKALTWIAGLAYSALVLVVAWIK